MMRETRTSRRPTNVEDDKVPDPLAELDQLAAGLATRAKVLHDYYAALVGEGFTASEALALVLGFQSGMS
jgi:hypothetical protein